MMITRRAVECMGIIIDARNAEIKRLKERIKILEKPDIFWIADDLGYGCTDSIAGTIEIFLEDKKILKPVEIQRAVSLPNIWAVLEGKDDDIIEHEFSTEEEADKFCQKMRGNS